MEKTPIALTESTKAFFQFLDKIGIEKDEFANSLKALTSAREAIINLKREYRYAEKKLTDNRISNRNRFEVWSLFFAIVYTMLHEQELIE
jgi:hypothetical protein